VTSLISVYPGRSFETDGLRVDIRPKQLASVFGVPEEAVRQALPGYVVNDDDGPAFGEVRYFHSVEEVVALTSALSPARDDRLQTAE